MHSEKNTYFLATHCVLDSPSGDISGDGEHLVQKCLDSVGDLDNFPPKLLVLLATPSFQPFNRLLSGIQNELRRRKVEVPLIGCSVAGVVTGQDTFLKGVTLVCLASRFMSATIGIAKDALDDNKRKRAIRSLCEQVGLTSEEEDHNPYGNRYLLCLLPGFTKTRHGVCYKAPEIHREILRATGARIPMVGGAAGDDFKREYSWQFINDVVDNKSAVVALLESELRFGIAMGHNLEQTGDFLHVEEVTEDGHRILSFQRSTKKSGKKVLEEKTALEILKECSAKYNNFLLSSISPEGERIELSPRQDKPNNSVYVSQPVYGHQSVEILKFGPDSLHSTATEISSAAVRKGHIDPFHLGTILGFICMARYELMTKIGLNMKSVLEELAREHSCVPIIGGLMCGEIGQQPLGSSVIRSWTVTLLLISDERSARNVQRRAQGILAGILERMGRATSTTKVLRIAMSVLREIGFPGGMISLAFKHRGQYMIVAREALGINWKRIIKMTERVARGGDILAIVGDSHELEFIPDSREDPRCEKKSARTAKVISHVVLPLIVLNNKLIGTIQIDLGDMSNRRDLPKHMKVLLSDLAGCIAMALSHSMQIHEFSLSNLFDRALGASMAETTVASATQKFIDVLTENKKLVGTDLIHVRLATNRGLELIAGCGAYYEAARNERPIISFDSLSPTAKTFRNRRPKWVNRIEDDKESQKFISSMPKGRAQKILMSEGAYANLLIKSGHKGSVLGVIDISSTKRWFFSKSRLRSMKTLGHRLYFALRHAEKVESENQKAKEVAFLMNTTPKLSTGLDLRTALQENAVRIAHATSAEKVSFFLWDDKEKSLILQGYFGWTKDMIGQAEYKLGEGMTGKVAQMQKPIYISDLEKWKTTYPPQQAKYEKEMFGEKSENARYEVIGIPLKFSDLLGVLTLQNMIELSSLRTKFTTTDETGLLNEVADDLSAFIYASNAYERRVRRLLDEKRSRKRINYAATIVGNLTHDLRNDLGSILSDVRTLVDDLHDGTEKKRAQRVESVCQDLSSRMDKYLRAIERKELPIWTKVELENVFSNAQRRCFEKSRQRNVLIKLNSEPKIWVKGAEIELENAFYNIIDNGLNSMDHGGVLQITSEVNPKEQMAVVRIIDQGRGIPKGDISQIQEGFFGSGEDNHPAMGVFLAKDVIEHHGGNFNMQSTEGKGTTVLISLPLLRNV